MQQTFRSLLSVDFLNRLLLTTGSTALRAAGLIRLHLTQCPLFCSLQLTFKLVEPTRDHIFTTTFSRRCFTTCGIFIPQNFMNLSFSFLLFSAAGALCWRHFAAAFAADCYRLRRDAISVALPLPCTSADTNSSANISSSTTLASNGTTCTTNDPTFYASYHSTTTDMAAYSSLSSTTDTTTTRVSSSSHFSNSLHFTSSRAHVSFH